MDIILKQDVKNLGEKDEIVKVKPGYGRNYLIPQGYAILATESARKVLAENLKQAQFKQDKIRKDADELAARLEQSVIEGENPVFDTDYQCFVMHSQRVELFGNAAQNGW